MGGSDDFCDDLDRQRQRMVDDYVWPFMRERGYAKTERGVFKQDENALFALQAFTSHQYFGLWATIGYQDVLAFLRKAPPGLVYHELLEDAPAHLRLTVVGGIGDAPGWALLGRGWRPVPLDTDGPDVVRRLKEEVLPQFDELRSTDSALRHLQLPNPPWAWIQREFVLAALRHLRGDSAGARQAASDALSTDRWGERARTECFLQFLDRQADTTSAGPLRQPLVGYYGAGPYFGDPVMAVRVDGAEHGTPGSLIIEFADHWKVRTSGLGSDVERGARHAVDVLRRHGMARDATRVTILNWDIHPERGAPIAYTAALAVWNAFGFLPPEVPPIKEAEKLFQRPA